MSTLNQRVSEISKRVQQKVGQRDKLLQLITECNSQQAILAISIDTVAKAKVLLEAFVKTTEGAVREYLEPTVTEALNFIFNQSLYFHIVFVERRGQVEIDFIILPNIDKENEYQSYVSDSTKSDELEELVKEYKELTFLYGGAIQEVLGVVLRFILVELLQIQGPVLLDEPTSAVHEEYAQKVGVFIKTLSERFNRQVIYVTHSQALAMAANKVYEVSLSGGESQVKEIV